MQKRLKQIQQSKLVNISPSNSLLWFLNLLLKLLNVFKKIVNKVLITRNRNSIHRVQRPPCVIFNNATAFVWGFWRVSKLVVTFSCTEYAIPYHSFLIVHNDNDFYSKKGDCGHARRTWRTLHSTFRRLRSVYLQEKTLNHNTPENYCTSKIQASDWIKCET